MYVNDLCNSTVIYIWVYEIKKAWDGAIFTWLSPRVSVSFLLFITDAVHPFGVSWILLELDSNTFPSVNANILIPAMQGQGAGRCSGERMVLLDDGDNKLGVEGDTVLILFWYFDYTYYTFICKSNKRLFTGIHKYYVDSFSYTIHVRIGVSPPVKKRGCLGSWLHFRMAAVDRK